MGLILSEALELNAATLRHARIGVIALGLDKNPFEFLAPRLRRPPLLQAINELLERAADVWLIYAPRNARPIGRFRKMAEHSDEGRTS